MGREGEPLDHLTVILEGEIRIQRGKGADEINHQEGLRGQVTGLLPYSRLTHYGGTSRRCFPLESLTCTEPLPGNASAYAAAWATAWFPSWPTASARRADRDAARQAGGSWQALRGIGA